MHFKIDKTNNSPIDILVIFATIVYYVLIDAVRIIVGAEGSRLGGMILIGQLLILIILYLIGTKGRLYIKLSAFHIYFVLFVTYCFANCLWASYYNQAIARTEQLAEMAILMVVVYTIFDRRENAIDELLTVIMLGGFFLVGAYIIAYGWTYIIISLRNADRIASDIINANTLGMAAAYSCVIFFYKLTKKRIQIWWIPLLVLSFITLFVSQSRKAILILILGLFGVFALNNYKEKNKLKTIGRIIAALFAVIGVVFLLEHFGALSGVNERFEGLINLVTGRGVIDKSTLQRTTLISLGIDLFKGHPIGGVGIDCARYFSPYGTDYHLHNNYIELLADGGIVGLIIYYWLYLLIILRMIKYRNFDDPEFNICLVILVIRLVMDYGYYSFKEQGTYFFLLLFYFCYRKLNNEKGTASLNY